MYLNILLKRKKEPTHHFSFNGSKTLKQIKNMFIEVLKNIMDCLIILMVQQNIQQIQNFFIKDLLKIINLHILIIVQMIRNI